MKTRFRISCWLLAALLPLHTSGAIKNCLLSKDKISSPLPLCTSEDIAERLGWRLDANPKNLCHGFYEELPFALAPSRVTDTVQIQADRVSLFREGRSTASGNVLVDEPGKQMSADSAIIDRNGENGAVTRVQLEGHVMVREPQRMIFGERADFDNQKQEGTITSVLYRAQTKNGAVQAWGAADKVHRTSDGNYQFVDATYATCPPLINSWHLLAKELELNKKTNRGVAKHTLLYAGALPLIYLPYLNFSLDNERKSGFLIPTLGYNNRTGADFSIPFYWNITPNTDMTITPRYLSQRGVLFEDEWRYLTEKSQGVLFGQYLPNDQRFLLFKENNFIPGTGHDRGSFFWKNETIFNQNWRGTVDYNTVSDDNFFQDFGDNLALTTQNQIPQQANIRYSDPHWFFQTGVQTYQTLNPLNQPRVDKIYGRMPQVLLNGDFPDAIGPFSFRIENEYDYFIDGLKSAEGNRATTIPTVSMNLNSPSGFLKGTADYHTTLYRLHNVIEPYPNNVTRDIPQLALDVGTFFERDARLFNHDWVQTLEPRLFYLYVPNHQQSDLPIFDSSPYVFNVDQLFRMNRFAGLDRIADANQLSAALTTRWQDADSGTERFHASVGSIFYFDDRRVPFCEGIGCVESPLLSGYQSPEARMSPVATEMAYQINPEWQLLGNAAWDFHEKAANNASAHIHYQTGPRQIIDLSYSYLVNGDPDPRGQLVEQAHNDMHQLRIGIAEPLTSEWSAVGQWSYNMSQRYSLTYYLGLEYGSCCWSLRVLGGKLYSNFNAQFRPEYQNTVMVQLMLKGLGTIGNQNPSKTLSTVIPGYRDLFH